MAKSRALTLRFPLAGVDKRGGFQAQPPFTTPAALNVLPDDVVQGRARGGSRPGLSKAITTDRTGPYQFITSVEVNAGSGTSDYQRYLVAGERGYLLYAAEGATTWTEVSSGGGPPYTNTTAPSLAVAVREQKLYIADYANVSGTDGAIDAGYDRVISSAAVGSWVTAGISAANLSQWTIEFLDTGSGGAVIGTYSLSGTNISFANEGSIAIVNGVVTKTGGTAFPAWAAAGSLTVGGNTYTINTRDGDNQVTLDNLTVNVGSTGTYTVDLAATQLWLSSDPGNVSTTGIDFRLHRTPKIWNLTNQTVGTWTASTGTTPQDCQLLTEYRDRMVLAKPVYDENLWYASRSGDPLDFNYGEFDATSAVASSNYIGGRLGEPLRALIPHGYDCLIMGAQDAIYVLRGDPANSGSHLIKVDDVVGILSANAWCKTASDDTVMLTRDGLYIMPSGCGVPPTSISRERLPEELIGLDPTDRFVSLAYDPLLRCVHVWVTDDGDGSTPAVTTAWLYHIEHKAFWPVTLPAAMQPSAVYDFSPLGTANKSSVLLGGYDGIVRQFDKAAEDDDGTNFTSYVRIGPFMLSPNSDTKGVIQRMRIVMGADSAAATWGLGAAATMEGVTTQLEADSHFQTGTVDAYAAYPRVGGHAAMLEIGSSGSVAQWIFEEAVITAREAGRMRT